MQLQKAVTDAFPVQVEKEIGVEILSQARPFLMENGLVVSPTDYRVNNVLQRQALCLVMKSSSRGVQSAHMILKKSQSMELVLLSWPQLQSQVQFEKVQEHIYPVEKAKAAKKPGKYIHRY